MDGGLCYVIASWTGRRRCGDPKYEADPFTYVREHLKHLKTLRHGIDKIVVYFPYMKNEPAHITQTIDAMRLSADAFVDVQRRVNLGQSYGSFHDAYEEYGNKGYRWWFFVEDDYVPTQHNFDEIFRNLFESEPECSLCTPLLVGAKWPNYGFVEGPGAGIGFTSAEVLEQIWKRNGGFERFAGEVDYRFDDQLLWGIVFAENGKLLDTRGKYCFAYKAGNWGTRIYHEPQLPLLFAPIQDSELLVNHDLRFGMKNLPLIPAPAEL